MTAFGKKAILWGAAFLVVVLAAVWLFFGLRPAVSAAAEPQDFKIAAGAGLGDIARALQNKNLIRSTIAFKAYAVLTGRALRLQPGHYQLNPAESGAGISAILAAGPELETTVTIPEGFTAADIDTVLNAADVTAPGEFLKLARESKAEGRLFPDTYRFYFDSEPQAVLDRMLANFERRAAPRLAADPENAERNLILASILEKEVPDQEERRIVAGILLKRAARGMALQVDASICYIKEALEPDAPCEPITALDKKIESPYNTYSNSGWPPGAIANPGVLAIDAALAPAGSLYWYYISDPATGKTIFAQTIDEQVANQRKYLRKN